MGRDTQYSIKLSKINTSKNVSKSHENTRASNYKPTNNTNKHLEGRVVAVRGFPPKWILRHNKKSHLTCGQLLGSRNPRPGQSWGTGACPCPSPCCPLEAPHPSHFTLTAQLLASADFQSGLCVFWGGRSHDRSLHWVLHFDLSLSTHGRSYGRHRTGWA